MVLGIDIPRHSRLCKPDEELRDCKLRDSRDCVIDFGAHMSHGTLRHPVLDLHFRSLLPGLWRALL